MNRRPARLALPLAVLAVLAAAGSGCGDKSTGAPDAAATTPATSAPTRVPGASKDSVWTPDQLEFLRKKFGELQTSATGLKFTVLQPGQGEPPPRGKKVSVHYEGRFLDDQVFDSSRKRGKPIQFRVGTNDMIKGFDEGVAQMRKGEKRLLVIPYWLGYGPRYHGPIPPSSTLVFEVELLGWEDTVGIPSSQS